MKDGGNGNGTSTVFGPYENIKQDLSHTKNGLLTKWQDCLRSEFQTLSGLSMERSQNQKK